MLHFQKRRQYSMQDMQTGAVLIVTLLFLVLITVIGIIAIRNSTTNLKLATSDQINTVLLQSSDSANNKLEQSVNGAPSSDEYIQVMGLTGVFGRYILDEGNRGDIVDFCYRPRTNFFNMDNAVIRRGSGKLVDNNDEGGYCNPTKSTDYTSSRQTSMTQVMVKNIPAANKRLEGYKRGSDTLQKNANRLKFAIYSTSVLPAYGSSSSNKVKDCFAKDASASGNPPSESVVKCMTDNGIPSKMLIENVNVENSQISDYCKLYGSASATTAQGLCSTL